LVILGIRISSEEFRRRTFWTKLLILSGKELAFDLDVVL